MIIVLAHSPVGLDYNRPTGSFMLSPGSSSMACLDVTILNDDILEGPEEFTGTLQGFIVGGQVVTSITGVNLDPQMTVIEIADNDG